MARTPLLQCFVQLGTRHLPQKCLMKFSVQFMSKSEQVHLPTLRPSARHRSLEAPGAKLLFIVQHTATVQTRRLLHRLLIPRPAHLRHWRHTTGQSLPIDVSDDTMQLLGLDAEKIRIVCYMTEALRSSKASPIISHSWKR